MKKILCVITLVVFISAASFSQNNIVGKWKIAGMKEDGKPLRLIYDSLAFCTENYNTILQDEAKAGKALTAKDSTDIWNEVATTYSFLADSKFEFKSNKTVVHNLGSNVKSGTYTYNPKTKILMVKHAKGKARKLLISFVDKRLVMYDTVEKIYLYYDKMK